MPPAAPPAPASTHPAAVAPAGAGAPRAEHDALAARLAARTSILEVRRASIAFFAAVLLLGLTGKLAWDRWGIVAPGEVAREPQHGPALHVWAVMLLSVAAFLLSIRWFRRARALMAEEDALFARLKALRVELGFGP